MNKKILFLILFGFLLIYPGYSLIQVEQVNSGYAVLEEFQRSLTNFQISILVSWVFMIGIAIYYKWTREKNIFFFLIYIYLIISNIFFGIYFGEMVTNYRIPTTFEDDYTIGVLKGLQNFAVSAVLTALIQAAVWWFTRRWHRR